VNSSRSLTALAAAAAGAALLGAAWMAARFFAAQRRILLTTTQQPSDWKGRIEERRRGFTGRERNIRDHFFDANAAENGAASLRALELRAYRLEGIAQRLPKTRTRKPTPSEPKAND